MVTAGQYITDGTAVFLVCDIRDGAQVGDIKMSPILRKGYVKANGALLTGASTNYPRLVAFVQENPTLAAADDTAWADNKALYVYDDTNDTLRVPDATGRVLQGGASVESLEAGLPNVQGSCDFRANAFGMSDTAFSGSMTYATGRRYNDYLSSIQTSLDGGRVVFDASRSNLIYSNSQTVQPPALTLIPQIKY